MDNNLYKKMGYQLTKFHMHTPQLIRYFLKQTNNRKAACNNRLDTILNYRSFCQHLQKCFPKLHFGST